MRFIPHLHTRKTGSLVPGVLLLTTSIILVSCGGPSRPPETDISGYQQLRDQLGDYDFIPLAGRRIVLDPGHGGRYRGAVGLNGLTEAEVNLGVALFLRGLLEWANAQVYMTRTADHDLLAPGDASLTADLAARVAFCDSIRPDVFVSIHHNSNAELDRDLNETQTYYPVGREGADLDLARSIHKYLVRNLEIDPAKIMAGNFYVLRNATVPAVLGEPSMISNPTIEKRLSLAAKQELEAKAYFLGLLEYFAGGTPHFADSFGDTLNWENQPGRWLSWTFAAGDTTAPGLDPSSVDFRVDGRQVALSVNPDGRTLTWYPDDADLRSPHRIELRARNLSGRATPVRRLFSPGLTAETFAFTSHLITEDPGHRDPYSLFAWRSLGRPLSELPILWLARSTGNGGCGEAIARLPVFPGHEGWLLVPSELLASADADALVICLEPATAGSDSPLAPTPTASLAPATQQLPASLRWCVLARPPGFWPATAVPGGSLLHRLEPVPASAASAVALASSPTWPVCLASADSPLWLEAAGALPIVAEPVPIEADRLTAVARPDTFWWQPVLPDLIDKVIVLDPSGGGSEADGTGPLGSRGADLNLRVAEMTAALLRGAGARPVLTRRDERWIPPEEKIALANRQRADLFLTIGRSGDPERSLVARHHHGSVVGTQWATFFARAAASLLQQTAPTDSLVDVGPSYAYLLRHTASPALMVGLESPHSLASEERLNHASYQQAQARALFASMAAVFVGEEFLDRQVDIGRLLTSGTHLLPRSADITWIKWDGNFPWLPPTWSAQTGDSVSFQETPGLPAETDRHYLEIRTRTGWQLWSVIPTAKGNWTWHQLLEDSVQDLSLPRTTENQGTPDVSSPPTHSAAAGGSRP